MFRRRSRRFRGGGRSSRRNKEWTGWTTTVSPLTYFEPRTVAMLPGDRFASWIYDPGAIRSDYDEPTVVRILARITAFVGGSNAALAGSYRATIRGGFIPWKASTLGFGATDLDGIDCQDPTLDWLFWDEFHFWHSTPDLLGTTQVVPTDTENLGKIDLRAKRKLENGFGLAGAFEYLSDSTLATMWFRACGRFLLLNH